MLSVAGETKDGGSIREIAEEALLADIEQAVEKASPTVKARFLKAVQEAIDNTDLAEFAAALAKGDVEAALDAIPWEDFQSAISEIASSINAHGEVRPGPLAGPFNAGVDAALGAMPTPILAAIDPTAIRSEAAQWLQEHGLEMAEELTAETREGIKTIIADALDNGGADAYDLRSAIASLIGLNGSQAGALDKYIDALMSTDLTAPQIQRAIDQKYKAMLNYRAETIARTESSRAGNAGQVDVWKDGAEKGAIDDDAYVMEWVARGDACDECSDLDGETADIGGQFPNDGGDGPPLHPRCYCAVRLVRRKDEEE